MEGKILSAQALFEWLLRLAALGIIITCFCIAYLYVEVNLPKVNRVVISSEKLSPGTEIKILQISDFHNWHPNDNHQKLLQQIRQLNPDLIVITGDLIDRKTTDFNNVYTMSRELVQINQHTYYVCGNHEWARAHSKAQAFLSGLANCGVKILDNEHVVWSKDQLVMNICGVNYYPKGSSNLNKATEAINTELFTLLLAHAPDVVEMPAITRTDLVVCGHTHGGQIRLPLLGAIIAPDQGFLPTYDKGIYHITPRTSLYIDSGLGTSALPIRIFNRSQISLITVTGK